MAIVLFQAIKLLAQVLFLFSSPIYLAKGTYLGAQLATLFVIAGLAAVQRNPLGRISWLILLSAAALDLVIIEAVSQSVPFAVFYHSNRWLVLISIVVFVATLIAACTAAIVTLRERRLGRWSILPLLAVVLGLFSLFGVGLAEEGFSQWVQQNPPYLSYYHARAVVDVLLILPGWVCALGIGRGLLQAVEPQPAVQPSDAVQ
ncbi:MAG: hypothetical protein H0X24_17950 [Ktedonobacterales bacterium]|nr:hypothetical protein [Ktedonobacterales bacterium]